MAQRKKKTSKLSEIKLEARLDVSAAEALHAELLDKRNDTGGLTVNASAVTMIDTPAIQVLLAAAKDLEGQGEAFHLKDSSEEIGEAMALLGLSNEFEQWSSPNV